MFNRSSSPFSGCHQDFSRLGEVAVQAKSNGTTSLAELEDWGNEVLERIEIKFSSFVTQSSKRMVSMGFPSANRKR